MGDRWCVSAKQWMDALNVGKAPRVIVEATNMQVFEDDSDLNLPMLEKYKSHFKRK